MVGLLWRVLLVVLGVVAPSGLLLGQSPPPDEDVHLMLRLRSRIMSIPESRRDVEGVGILLEHVEEFRDELTKKRVFLSIAELFVKLGDKEQSVIYFEKAGAMKSPGSDPSGVDSIARGRILDVLAGSEKRGGVEARALEYRDAPQVSDLEYAELTYRAAFELVASGKIEEGIRLATEAASSRPCDATYQYLETLANDAHSRGGALQWLRTMRWIEANGGSFGESERFLSNLAFTEEASGNIDEAIRVVEELTAAYPLSPRAAEQLLRLSFLYSKAGDDAKSRANTARVRDGDYPEEFRVMARRSLDLSSDSGPPSADIDRNGTGSPWRVAMLVLNGLLVLAIVGFMWARRKSASGRRP
jgi:tetratricopeptide (TPR) repeat protein